MTVDDLIRRAQYTVTGNEREALFVPVLTEAFLRNAERCQPFARFLQALSFDPRAVGSISDFPPLPVSMFKHFELRVCDQADVVRELHSSGTTGQTPSRIFLDKETVHLQGRALLSILQAELGSQRRPFLVLDTPDVVASGHATLTARGAAIRGMQQFATETRFALCGDKEGMRIDWPALDGFTEKHAGEPVLVFGFTFVIWSVVVAQLQKANRSLGLPQATVLHGGGWKALREQRVSRDHFNGQVAQVIGCPPSSVLDYYGMVEQVGSIFVDCPAGNKHPPNFATVVVRDPLTFLPQAEGGSGLIEVVSLLPKSYPGQVLLSEDLGEVRANDNCPCGRKGIAFRFTSRVEHAELRGCGDVLAQAARPVT